MSTQVVPERGVFVRFVHWMCKHVFLDILSETDSFPLMLRKIVVNSGICFFVHPSYFFGLNLYYAVQNGFTAAAVVALVASAGLVALWVWCYAYARLTRTIPDFVIDAWILVGSACMTLIGHSSTYPTLIPLVAGALNATLVRTPRMWFSLAVISISFAFSAWNVAAIKTGVAPLFLPGTRPDTFYEHLINNASSYVVSVVPLGSVILQSMRNGQMLNAANDAADLSRRVANHLQNYNTDAVELELAEYRETAAKPDPELIKSYEALVNNLNRYRPHLPNWMVNDETTDGATDASDCRSEEPSSARSAAEKRSSHLNDSMSDAPSLGGRHGHHMGTTPPLKQLTGGFACPQTITYAEVDFVSRNGEGLQQRSQSVTNFVDRVHEWAAVTSASLHSFVGDTLHVSWNATHKVVQPEAKAARFMARVVAANGEGTGVAATGAASTGKAACQFSGSGRVQALTISMPWQRAQRQAVTFAAHHNTVVMDAVTAKNAAFSVESRGVDIVAVPGDPAAVEVHEVVGERKVEPGEWMYVLEKESPNDVVTAALRLAVDGRCGEAIESLESVDSEAVLPPMVARLRDRLHEAVTSGSGCLRPWSN
jgi:hypothetical protein